LYLSLLPIAYFSSFFASMLKGKLGFFFLFGILQMLGVLLALDANMTDFPNYMRHYFNVPSLSELIIDPSLFQQIYGEPLFAVMQITAKSLDLNYIEFRIVFYFILMTFNALLFSKLKGYAFLAVLWYFAFFYHNDGNIMRVAMASTLLMLCVYYYGLGRFLYAVVCFFSAVMFHYLSLVLLPILALHYLKVGKRFIILSIIFSLLFSFFVSSRELLLLVGGLANEESFIFDKIYRYAYGYESGGAGAIRFITVIPLVLISTILYKYKQTAQGAAARLWVLVFTMSLCSLFFFGDFRLFADRIYTMLGYSGAVILVLSVSAFERRSKIIYKAFWIFLILFFIVFKYRDYYWNIGLG